MERRTDFEDSNAREWDDESSIKSSRPMRNTPPSTTLDLAMTPALLRPISSLRPRNNHNPAQSKSTKIVPHVQESRPRPIWADPKGLVTDKFKDEQEVKVQMATQKSLYLGQPNKDEELPVNCFYLWTVRERSPTELLGSNLQELHTLRTTYDVYIKWDASKGSLHITSHATMNQKARVAGVVKGIRRAIANGQARCIMASPIYIVVPPSAKAMRTIVRPRTYETIDRDGCVHRPALVSSLELSGLRLSDGEREIWHSQWEAKTRSSIDDFRVGLVDKLLPLATLREWMRMRVHFGRLKLSKYREDFAKSKYGYETFVKMIGNPRLTGYFDRRLTPAITAVVLREHILRQPEIFAPVDPTLRDLRDVEFKHTEVIFVTNAANQEIRIEAVVDKAEAGHYQIGTSKVFWENTRNKRVEIVTIDLERGLDWTLEVITDGTTETPILLQRLIEESLPCKDTERVDALGLTYPSLSLPRYDGQVNRVALKSVAHFKMEGSGYVVEIAIYREWKGRQTRSMPEISSSVSMYHPVWDLEMESLEDTTKERGWNRDLTSLFGTSMKNLESNFLSVLGIIHDLVAIASKDSESGPYAMDIADPCPSIKSLSPQKKETLVNINDS